jgi:hypothetical protein
MLGGAAVTPLSQLQFFQTAVELFGVDGLLHYVEPNRPVSAIPATSSLTLRVHEALRHGPINL